MIFMWFGSLDGRKAVHRRGLRSCTRAGAGTGGARGFRQALGALRGTRPRTHRSKSSAAQINLFGAALTALRQAKAAEQNGGSALVLLASLVTQGDVIEQSSLGGEPGLAQRDQSAEGLPRS
jgi:hypothetical protein